MDERSRRERRFMPFQAGVRMAGPHHAKRGKGKLGKGDIWKTHPKDESAVATRRLQKLLERERERGHHLHGNCSGPLQSSGLEWLACALLKFTGEAMAYVQPIILSLLLTYIENNFSGNNNNNNDEDDDEDVVSAGGVGTVAGYPHSLRIARGDPYFSNADHDFLH